MIEAVDLSRVYRMGTVDVQALRGVSFAIDRGEFVGIMGSSGSGKSTLLHIMGLLDRPTTGSLTVDGVDVLALSERERTRFRLARLGYVFQDYALIGELSALENVFLTPLVRGAGRGEYLRAAREILDEVGLLDRADHLQFELSGGEQQRVAIARALVNDPDLLLCDEPTGNLDRKTGSAIMDLLAAENREGKTVIMVTHDPEVAAYARRIIRIVDGKVA